MFLLKIPANAIQGVVPRGAIVRNKVLAVVATVTVENIVAIRSTSEH